MTGRFGSDVRGPRKDDLRYALDQLFNETDPDISQAAYETHPDARLRWGQDNGPLFVLTVNRHGRMTFEQWADQDMDEVMAPPCHRDNVSVDDALLFWKMLIAGDIPDLQQIFSDHPHPQSAYQPAHAATP